MAKSLKQPKEYRIPSNSWGITADEAGNILIQAEEIKAYKELNEAALASLKSKKLAINEVI